MDQASAFWLNAPGSAALCSVDVPTSGPAPGQDMVEIRTRFSGISRGTESLVFHGRVPASEHQRMRAPFQEGEFPAPVKFGYSSVGDVVKGPDALLGQTVFCLYPHQDRYRVPAEAVYPLPDTTPPERAILAANMETAINALWDAAPLIGERITVIGAGVVGALVAYLCQRLIGTRVQLLDINPQRAELAKALGVFYAHPKSAKGDQDLILHATGHEGGLAKAIELAGLEARIIEMSWYGDRQVGVSLGGAFHSRRLTLRSSQVGHLPTAQQPRWSIARRMALALELLADPALDALISGDTPFEELPEVAPVLFGDASGVLCQRIVYPDTPVKG